MSAELLDGRRVAERLKRGLAPRIEALTKARGRAPGLLVLGARKDPASRSYQLAQAKACEQAGLRCSLVEPEPATTESLIEALRRGADYDAAIVDLPLPKSVDVPALLAALAPERDAEGVTPAAFGRLLQAKTLAEIDKAKLIAPCTAAAIVALLRETRAKLAGKSAVVLGRSSVVGKPAAHLLSCLDMTVTLCHSKTNDLRQVIGRADVVVAAVGKPRLIKAGWIKSGAIVIDAGTTLEGKRLVGDVDPRAAERASFFSPVPGGVGPVTTAMLLSNVVTLAERAS